MDILLSSCTLKTLKQTFFSNPCKYWVSFYMAGSLKHIKTIKGNLKPECPPGYIMDREPELFPTTPTKIMLQKEVFINILRCHDFGNNRDYYYIIPHEIKQTIPWKEIISQIHKDDSNLHVQIRQMKYTEFQIFTRGLKIFTINYYVKSWKTFTDIQSWFLSLPNTAMDEDYEEYYDPKVLEFMNK